MGLEVKTVETHFDLIGTILLSYNEQILFQLANIHPQ